MRTKILQALAKAKKDIPDSGGFCQSSPGEEKCKMRLFCHFRAGIGGIEQESDQKLTASRAIDRKR